MAKQAGKASITPTASAEAAQPNAVARQTEKGEVAPSSTATRKQNTDSPQVAKANGEPTPASGPKSTIPLPTTTASRQPSQQSGPQVGAAANKIPGQKSKAATGNVVTTVADVAANSAPTQAADFNPQPSSSQGSTANVGVRRRGGHTEPNAAFDAPQQSASNQIAQGSPARAQSASLPALQVPTGSNASDCSARASRSAEMAASPTNVESPALAAAAQGTGDTSAQPARMALSKSLAGVAGAGQSANLDRATPAGESPAMVASGSAQRAKSTQNTPEGAALAPSAPAAISRSVAGADRPSSTTKAEEVDFATTGATKAVGEINASSSAAVVQEKSKAAAGEVTAAKGNIEVDLGPTQIVAEKGRAGASGGGQPGIEF